MEPVNQAPHWVLTLNYQTDFPGTPADILFQERLVDDVKYRVPAVNVSQFHTNDGVRRYVFRAPARAAVFMAHIVVDTRLRDSKMRYATEIREAAEVNPQGSGLWM